MTHSPYRGARVTEEGAQIATRLLNTHNCLVAFLHGVLGYSKESAAMEAEHLEHHASAEFMKRLEMWMNQEAK